MRYATSVRHARVKTMRTLMPNLRCSTAGVLKEHIAPPLFFVEHLDEATLIWYSPSLGAEGSGIMPTRTPNLVRSSQPRRRFSVLSWLMPSGAREEAMIHNSNNLSPSSSDQI